MTTTTTTNAKDLDCLDRGNLIDLMYDKDKRIQELERLLYEQKKLRLQDSSQVEEKAAKIKEWVTNKLKELENQNKSLRDQNRRQKETIDGLNFQLRSFNRVLNFKKPLKQIDSLDNVESNNQICVPASPINTIDVTQSLKTRRPQLKKLHTDQQLTLSSSSGEEDQNLRITLNSIVSSDNILPKHNDHYNSSVNINGVSHVSIDSKYIQNKSSHFRKQESPLYDSVNVEMISSSDHPQDKLTKLRKSHSKYQQENNAKEKYYHHSPVEPMPPPPPLHQFDRWEQELYSLAENTFSSLMRPDDHEEQAKKQENNGRGTLTQTALVSKTFSRVRNDIISVIKPSFTTIDGDQVIDSDQLDLPVANQSHDKDNDYEKFGDQRFSHDHSSQTLSTHILNRSLDAYDNSDNSLQNQKYELIKPRSNESQNLFCSPMRSKLGKDSILRTQSIRRNPAPEKLYDFISADLVKRGYLVKHGALRSHSRWFVLKRFHLYSYKREAEETDKKSPTMTLKLEPAFQIHITSQSNDGYPIKITLSSNKSLLLIADSARLRDEWAEILNVTINMSDMEAEKLTKEHSQHEGLLTMTRHGHTKRCHAVLVKHVVFFLKSPVDPTPMSYVSIKGSKIREVTDNYDYDQEEQESSSKRMSDSTRDCNLAIYPKFSLNLDPFYLTFGSQQDTDEWFYHLSCASGLDQISGTKFEKVITQSMLDKTIRGRRGSVTSRTNSFTKTCCPWHEHPVMMYNDKPIQQPLTSLPNETLRVEALELFKSILLFTQAPIEPAAIDYHVCLLQNCLSRFLKYPELRNEFFAQLIKQSTYVLQRRDEGYKLPSMGSGGSISTTLRSSFSSVSPNSSECQFVTDVNMLETEFASKESNSRYETHAVLQHNLQRNSTDTLPPSQMELTNPPNQSELLQVMQILAIAVSINLPRGRLRWWLVDHLRKFANESIAIGKLALYTIKAIDRTAANGCRENVPSRTEILSILLRNPYDHSMPHSMPINFSDGSYLVVGADGSTTIEEFMASMSKSINIRPSQLSDFYLFADDPGDAKDLHILEPQRKVLDVVGWWEQSFKQNSTGRQKNTRVIKLMCKKRLVLQTEEDETDQERLFIVHQVNYEICSCKIPLNEALNVELGAIMTQLIFGDFEKAFQDNNTMSRVREHIINNILPQESDKLDFTNKLADQVIEHWPKLSGRTSQNCLRVYLNCIRRLRINE